MNSNFSFTALVLPWLVWGFVVVVGGSFVQRAHETTYFVAARDLRANHRLLEGDVIDVGLGSRFLFPGLTTRSGFVGRYVQHRIQRGETLELDQTFRGPRLAASAGAVTWFTLRDLPPQAISRLDVQDRIEVCNLVGDGSCGRFDIAAIACASADPATCSAAVDLTPAQRRRLAAAPKKELTKPPVIRVVTVHAGWQR